MELHYKTTAADYIALFNRYASGSVVAERFARATFFLIPALAWLSAILFYFKQHHLNYNYIFYGIFALILTVSLPKLYDLYQNEFWRGIVTEASLAGLVGASILSLTEAKVQQTTAKVTFCAAWDEVLRIEQTEQHIFIFMAPLLAMVVPRTAFEDTKSYHEFGAQIQTYHLAKPSQDSSCL